MAEHVSLPHLLERFPWLTERRVRSMVAGKRIPYWKFEGRLLFDPNDFQRLLDAGYVAAASGPEYGGAPPVTAEGAPSR